MKKLFGRDKPKMTKVTPASREPTTQVLPREANEIEPEQPPHQGHRPTFQPQPQLPKRSGSLGTLDPPRDKGGHPADERWELVRGGGAESPMLVPAPAAHDPPPPPAPAQRPAAPALTGSHSSLGSLPLGAAPGLAVPPPRPESPYSTSSHHGSRKQQQQQLQQQQQQAPNGPTLKKKPPHAPAAPPPGPPQPSPPHNWDQRSELSSREERKERWGFFSSDRAKERDKGKRREEEGQAEITRMIGYLVATASEDWSLVLELCERVSANETHAKEAAKALKREFKYAEPAAQLAAAKLWAIMVNNCSELFLDQCSSRKFLDTIEDLLTSNRTSPVVRERVLDVLAGTTHASLTRKHEGKRHEKDPFQTLWKKVKGQGQPDQGIPFDTEDAMFNPPTPRRASVYSDTVQSVAPLQPLRSPPATNDSTRPPHHHKSSRNRVIPIEEDIRRLLQECRVGRGNAALLSEALMYAKPQDLTKDIIREFFIKCQASQEFISMQIPWATAGADRSREQRAIQLSMQPDAQQHPPNELTVEEQLLAELLRANEELMDALRMYDDLERIGIEREAEERSRREVRMDRTHIRYRDADGTVYLEPPALHAGGGSSSRSSTPSTGSSPAASISVHSAPNSHPLPPIPNMAHQPHAYAAAPNGSPQRPTLGIPGTLQPGGLAPAPPLPAQQQQQQQQQLLPQGAAPRFGPRSPAMAAHRSRTPSPEPRRGAVGAAPAPHPGGSPQAMRRLDVSYARDPGDDGEVMTPVKPSAKALGKRPAPPPPERDGDRFDPDDLFHEHDQNGERAEHDEFRSSDSDTELLAGGPAKSQITYAYDAVAERHKQRIQAGKLALLADLAVPPKVNAVR